jgi:hypothetical protein
MKLDSRLHQPSPENTPNDPEALETPIGSQTTAMEATKTKEAMKP